MPVFPMAAPEMLTGLPVVLQHCYRRRLHTTVLTAQAMASGAEGPGFGRDDEHWRHPNTESETLQPSIKMGERLHIGATPRPLGPRLSRRVQHWNHLIWSFHSSSPATNQESGRLLSAQKTMAPTTAAIQRITLSTFQARPTCPPS